MQIAKRDVMVREVAKNYHDDSDKDLGVWALNDDLIVRPSYQRNFVYDDKKRDAVIDSIINHYPLGLIYWAKRPDGKLEVLDGQQRIISICSYINDEYSIDHRFWHNLSDDEKKVILDYELDVRVCDGTNDEKLAYFKRINVPGVVMTGQELLNATYVGPFLADAKQKFSKRQCAAKKVADGYIHGNPIRQELLKQALIWVADRDGLDGEQEYMAIHQNDKDANDLWQYFQQVISWSQMLFPKIRKKITDHQEWGLLYNQYHNNNYNTNDLDAQLVELIMNDDVKKKPGIVPFLLSSQDASDYKLLNLRQFTKNQILKQYEKQHGICPICQKHYDLDEMEADHIQPFSWGKDGWSSSDNLQMLCRHDNRVKSNQTVTN